MHIFQVIPRKMDFSKRSPSSVELCVSEWISGSSFCDSTVVIAELGDDPIIDVQVARLKPAPFLSSWMLAMSVKNLSKEYGCELIIKQQHISTAARIAIFNQDIPVVLQTHNYIEKKKGGVIGRLKNVIRRWEFSKLAGITFVSEATKADFLKNWPEIRILSAVVSNGFDFSTWHPREVRANNIICVGRVMREKGLLESAMAVQNILRDFPDWTGTFMLSKPDVDIEYFEEIKKALLPVQDRVEILQDIPFELVKRHTEQAAISIVASVWNEPFGRTALETHAGGGALVSSGTGGLREISGEGALYLDEITPREIEDAVRKLILDKPLRDKLSKIGFERVRDLFSLQRTQKEVGGKSFATISEKLDHFLVSTRLEYLKNRAKK